MVDVNTNGWPAVSDVHVVPLPGIVEGAPVRIWQAIASIHPEVEPQLLVIKVGFARTPTISTAPEPLSLAL
jgi:hypothetical protein